MEGAHVAIVCHDTGPDHHSGGHPQGLGLKAHDRVTFTQLTDGTVVISHRHGSVAAGLNPHRTSLVRR